MGLRALLERRPFENRSPSYVTPRSVAAGRAEFAITNMDAQLSAYEQIGILFQIVSRHAEATGEAQWDLYRIGGEAPLTNHPAAQIWRKPNPFMDQNEFVEMAVQHYDLVGECDWNVSRTSLQFADGTALSKMPLELWPVRPDRLTPVPHPTKFLEGWAYKPPGGISEPWRVDEVIQMKRPNPRNPYRGLAPVAAAMVDVYGERAAAQYNAMFFQNDASAGDIIKFPERLSQEAFDEFVERWRQQHQGVANSHRIGILEGADYIERKNSLRDMQFEELRKLNRDFIRQAFGYPKAMLGDTEDVNKAAALAGELIFKNRIVRPTLERLRVTLNTKLLPLFGTFANGLEFRFETPDLADKELELLELTSKSTAAKTLVDAGFDAAAVLKAVGLPEMAFEKPEIKPPSAPARSGDDSPPPTRRGRPSTTNDPEARALWQGAQQYWKTRPEASFEAVAGLLGVSERTLRRYKDAFAN